MGAQQEVKVKEQMHEVAKPGILKAIPKAGEAHPAAVNYNEIFAADRAASHRKAKHIKMQASDGLSLTGVAAMFCMNVLLKLPGPMGDKKTLNKKIKIKTKKQKTKNKQIK